ncbi:MAG: shikimate dehydrogenase, partial [Actinomycetota bacterium]|nr:shikimate dehydrogenase [Actinomycetota bacterium]
MPLAGPRSAAVLGTPIGHSLSPVLHRAAYAALGLAGWTYDAIECDESRLADLLAGTGPELAGYSATMPLKRAVLRVAAQVSPQARAIGAGNTLLPHAEGWYVDNTDWIGIRDALAAHAVPATGDVLLLGAGGTAQAALAALTGARSVTALVREPA